MTAIELTPATPEQCALIDERARQLKSGELDAGYWEWHTDSGYTDSGVYTWQFISYEPAQARPHYEIFKKWQTLVAIGAVGREEYKLVESVINSHESDGSMYELLDPFFWRIGSKYEIRKTDKHPDNIKPKPKLIDWSRVPAGTMTNFGIVIHEYPSDFEQRLTLQNAIVKWNQYTELRLVEQTKFTYWGGGDCPVPEGVRFEVIFRDGDNTRLVDGAPNIYRWTHANTSQSKMIDIIAYRIVGLSEGYTDNPEEAE